MSCLNCRNLSLRKNNNPTETNRDAPLSIQPLPLMEIPNDDCFDKIDNFLKPEIIKKCSLSKLSFGTQ